MSDSYSNAYTEAGVDVTAGYESVKLIKPMVESTYTKEVLGTLGGFGGMYEPDLKDIKQPVFISGTDGVGTKLKLAFQTGILNTVGIDCVAMCVNDIICSGASPMFFLDYVACGKNDPKSIAEIISGIVEGCKQAECALVGGETAEMPGFYNVDEFDMAGFSVGIVDKEKIIDGSLLTAGDTLIGLASSGVHSNGFSLVRKVFDTENSDITSADPDLGGRSLGEVLLTPTKIYVKAIKTLLKNDIDIHAISHITGGGFYENVPRMMSEDLTAEIKLDSFPTPVIFEKIKEVGEISDHDMYNTFNMGIGMILAVPNDQAQKTLEILDSIDEKAYIIGSVIKGKDGVILV